MPKRKRSNPTITKKYKRKKRSQAATSSVIDFEQSILTTSNCYDVGVQCEPEVTLDKECQSQATFLNTKVSCTQYEKTEFCEIGIQCSPINNVSVSTQCGVDLFDFTCQFDGVDLKNELVDCLPSPYILLPHSRDIEILSIHHCDSRTYVKTKIHISSSGCVSIYVHDKLLSDSHPIWLQSRKCVYTKDEVLKVLDNLSTYSVCPGNPDEEFHSLLPVGAGISFGDDSKIVAFREENFNAFEGQFKYSSTIRASDCSLLVTGRKCSSCHLKRKTLRQRYERYQNLSKRDIDFKKCNLKHCDLPRELLIKKLEWQKVQIDSLQLKVDKLERQLKQKILKEGVTVNEIQNLELQDLMSTCEKDVVQAFPDASSLPRLFWSQQIKNNQKCKSGMRWHPMIIRWCLALRFKSQVAYDTMREAGFITLPSNRTLFDYSHYIRSNLGLNADTLKVLKEEAEKQNMYSEEWRKYIGILFDEVKVKEDLVYDKVSGELIGYSMSLILFSMTRVNIICILDSVKITLSQTESHYV